MGANMKVSAGTHVQIVAVVDGRPTRIACRVGSIDVTTMVLLPTSPDAVVSSGDVVDLVHEGRTWRRTVVIAGRGSITIVRPDDLDGEDARRISRTRVDLAASIRTDDRTFGARLHDLSTRGCRLHTNDTSLTIGDVIALAVDDLELLATVASTATDAAGTVLGITFERASVEMQGRLFRLLGRLRAAANLAARTSA